MPSVKPIPEGRRSVAPYLIIHGAAKAIAAGATLKRPFEDQFYGDRLGSIVEPFGHRWHISTHIEDVSVEEIGGRGAALGRGRHA